MTYNVSAGKYEALEKENERLRERERELCAQVERLRARTGEMLGAIEQFADEAGHTDTSNLDFVRETLNETPDQSLREIRAEAVELVLKKCKERATPSDSGQIDFESVQGLAQQIREGKE